MFWKAKKNTPGLLGRWIVDTSDAATVNEFGSVDLQFGSEGNLTYTIIGFRKDQIILLTYRIEGSEIVTDQPSHPEEQRSKFEITGDKLIILFEGRRACFVRQ